MQVKGERTNLRKKKKKGVEIGSNRQELGMAAFAHMYTIVMLQRRAIRNVTHKWDTHTERKQRQYMCVYIHVCSHCRVILNHIHSWPRVTSQRQWKQSRASLHDVQRGCRHTYTRPEFSSKHVVTRYLFRLTHYHKNNSRKHRRLNISQRVCAHKRRPGQRQLSNIFLLLLLLQ